MVRAQRPSDRRRWYKQLPGKNIILSEPSGHRAANPALPSPTHLSRSTCSFSRCLMVATTFCTSLCAYSSSCPSLYPLHRSRGSRRLHAPPRTSTPKPDHRRTRPGTRRCQHGRQQRDWNGVIGDALISPALLRAGHIQVFNQKAPEALAQRSAGAHFAAALWNAAGSRLVLAAHASGVVGIQRAYQES